MTAEAIRCSICRLPIEPGMVIKWRHTLSPTQAQPWHSHQARPATKRAGDAPDSTGAAFGAPTARRDAELRRPPGSPVDVVTSLERG